MDNHSYQAYLSNIPKMMELPLITCKSSTRGVMTKFNKTTRKAHSELEGHQMISLKHLIHFQATRSLLFSKLSRKWRWTVQHSCLKVMNSRSRKLTKIPTSLIPLKPTLTTNILRRELLTKIQMPWKNTVPIVRPQGRSKRRTSPTQRRDRSSTKLWRWRGRPKCARTSFTLVNASLVIIALTPTTRMSCSKRNTFNLTTWPSSAPNSMTTRSVFVIMVKDANSFILSMIGERKLVWCKDYTREQGWQC